MVFLTDFSLPANPYPEDTRPINIVRSIFGPIWDGLSTTNVPGFDFSFAEFFIALLTAGLIGLILKTAFTYFGSHFIDGAIKHGSEKHRADKHKGKGE